MTQSLHLPTPDSSLLQAYRTEVFKIPVMTREDEQRLARRLDCLRRRESLLWRCMERDRRIREGAPHDLNGNGSCAYCVEALPGIRSKTMKVLERVNRQLERTRNEMIERSLHMVMFLVKRYQGVGVPILDLIQEGNASLFRAVEHFDWRRGVRFRTYATYWINQAFLSAIYNSSRTVRVPAYIQKAMKKINDAVTRLGVADPEIETLARESKLSSDQVKYALACNRRSYSLDGESGDCAGATTLDGIEDPSAAIDFVALEELTLSAHLQKALGMLTERERNILCMRYGIGTTRSHTLAEVGTVQGISLERVRQIQNNALVKLRGCSGHKLVGLLKI